MLNFGQLRCLLELGGSPYFSEFEQTSEMRNSQGTRGTRETPGFLQAAPLRCFFFLPPFYIAGPLAIGSRNVLAEDWRGLVHGQVICSSKPAPTDQLVTV